MPMLGQRCYAIWEYADSSEKNKKFYFVRSK